METLNIICVDDQQEVLDSVMRDLRPLTSHVRLEEASSVADCMQLIDQIDDDGDHVAIVISDQVMPGETGTELLGKVASDRRFTKTRKVLLTGQATHADTINAINDGHIDNYIEKPWQPEKLLATVKRLLTLYVLDAGLDHTEYMPVLDPTTLFTKERTFNRALNRFAWGFLNELSSSSTSISHFHSPPYSSTSQGTTSLLITYRSASWFKA